MIVVRQKGNFNKTEKFLKNNAVGSNYVRILEKYARKGVAALESATPIDSGETAKSWNYEIDASPGRASITWTNSHVVDGVPIAVILQYGHGTRNGGYVKGRDYINPVIRPIFDELTEEVWKEVTKQ